MKRYVVTKIELANYLLEKDCELIKIDVDKKHDTKNLVYIFKDTEELRSYIKEFYKLSK